MLAAVQEEHRPIAEQVARGGIPAVRRAIEEQNATARAAGQPEIRTEALLAIAEELVPRLKAAEWRDRAEAAITDVDDIALRDLRSVVSSADAGARDDESRELAAKLRAALDRRAAAQRDEWLTDLTKALDEGRLVRALRAASRPPDPSVRLPAEVATRLAESASAAMAPDAPADRWKTLLEAVAESPVRRSVKPVGLPEGASEDLVAAAQQQAGRIPALAGLLGIDMPPPPGPPRGAPKRPSRPGGNRPSGATGRPIPPPPVQAASAAAVEPATLPLTPATGVTSSMDEGAGTAETEGDPVSTGASAPEAPSPEPAPPTEVGVEAAEAAAFSESGDQGAATGGSDASGEAG
ncbi:MAG: hypothetical protein AVDCRST_MAG50-67 [uncultured Acidimicrobiales bacterium]|uniref:Uncharacterized protein n=1 Tax=uncultured Acidimicrobiales bacterium TaxID=310071 RepID=A0A6J4H260_9ACTN|nr:MAG: hypothetical protein AVDCRST_MAG50-67 [uncultured Acidimicrobiales bacterium]